jgi:hypothetical protein
MNFTADWTEKEDRKLKEIHECDWDNTCVMCKEYDDCSRAKSEVKMKYEVELWCNMQMLDKLATNDYEEAKSQYVKWYNEFSESLKGATSFKIDGEYTKIEWDWVNLLGRTYTKPFWEQKDSN